MGWRAWLQVLNAWGSRRTIGKDTGRLTESQGQGRVRFDSWAQTRFVKSNHGLQCPLTYLAPAVHDKVECLAEGTEWTFPLPNLPPPHLSLTCQVLGERQIPVV